MKHIHLSGLLIAPTVALMLAGCGSSGSSNPGSHGPRDNGVEIQGTVVGVSSRTYRCSVATNWTNAKGPISLLGAGVNSRNGWNITVTKNASYVFAATCNDRSDGKLPTASGLSKKVKATTTQAHQKIVIHVHAKS